MTVKTGTAWAGSFVTLDATESYRPVLTVTYTAGGTAATSSLIRRWRRI